MEHLVLSIIVWLLVFLLIPRERIVELRLVAAVSILWMIFVDNISSYLGYYSYQRNLIPIGTASFFQLLAYAGIGMLMINWLRESSLTKLLAVLTVAVSFLVLQYIYMQLGAFSYGSFDVGLSFIHSTAALSIFVWTSLAVVGEETVYSGGKKVRS